jgi:transcriptional regulator with XRE-family HTH domain
MATALPQDFGAFLRHRRTLANLSIEELAATQYMPPQTLAEVESGKRKLSDAQAMALILAVNRREKGKHGVDCICEKCQATQAGQFAARALQAGDRTAADRLSAASVYALLFMSSGKRQGVYQGWLR